MPRFSLNMNSVDVLIISVDVLITSFDSASKITALYFSVDVTDAAVSLKVSWSDDNANTENPELYEAIETAVEKRLTIGLTSQTGWSFAHMANIYARLEQGERALECLELLTRACVGPMPVT